jgi:hypothetical protein
MFPKQVKIKPAEQARKLERELREAAKLVPAEREVKLRELDERTQLLLDSIEDGCGLRLDGTLTHPPSGQQIWYDTTTVHTTCRSKIKKELVLTRNRRAAGKAAKDMQSAGLMAVHQKKLDRYSLLAALAERQVLDGLRAVAPVILPVAVSTHGEFCPGAVRVQEWLTSKYRERLLLEGDRDDGEKLEDLTAAFRGEFRSSLLVASCKGLADMLLAAGMPFAVKNGNSARGVGAIADDSAHYSDDDAREAITVSSRETSLSPIRLPINDTGQFIDSPIAPVIDFDFDSHVAATELVGDTFSIVVCEGFPVVI